MIHGVATYIQTLSREAYLLNRPIGEWSVHLRVRLARLLPRQRPRLPPLVVLWFRHAVRFMVQLCMCKPWIEKHIHIFEIGQSVRHDENFVLPAVYTKISGTLVIPLARLWHLQKKRVLRPQRVTLAAVIGAPGGAVLHQPGHLCAVVYMLTENASLLNEHFDASLEGIAVGFKYDEKRFKENWAAYLTSEDVTDSTLLETYRVICRVGPSPRYIKTLLGCGEAENCLKSDGKFPASSGSCRYALVQCDCSQHQQSGPFGMAWRKQLTRSWSSQLLHGQCPHSLPPPGTAERRPVLIVRGLSQQTWIFRGGLPNWSGGWFDKSRQEVEKGAPGATYIRYTPAIPGIQMEGWLQAMDKYCMEYQLERKIPGCVASVLAATPWLSLKRIWAETGVLQPWRRLLS